MKTIKICIALLLCSCTTYNRYVPYTGKNLLAIEDDLLKIKEFLQEDATQGNIEVGIARNYYNLMTTLAYDIRKEYEFVKLKRDGTLVYKVNKHENNKIFSK